MPTTALSLITTTTTPQRRRSEESAEQFRSRSRMPEIGARPVLRSGYVYRPRVSDYGILRGISPVSGRGIEALSLEDKKENIPPKRSGLRFRAGSRSPLPAWYPRTPLRDITVVVNAMERRRRRLRPIASPRNNQNLDSLPVSSPISVLEQGPSPEVSSPTSSQTSVSAKATEPETPLHVTSTFQAGDMTGIPKGLDKKFIEELESAVKERLKIMPKATREPQRSKLLMMR